MIIYRHPFPVLFQRYRVYEFTWPPFCLKNVASSFMVNFLELEEPFIYGYVPRYVSELVENQGSLCDNITIAYTLSKNTSMHVL